MILILALAVVFVAGFLIAAVVATVFPSEVPSSAMGVAIGVSTALGYALSAPFLFWEPHDSRVKRALAFPAISGALSGIGAFVGLAPTLAWAFSASFVPGHAGMLGWLTGVVVSTLLIVLASRFVDSRISKRPWKAVASLRATLCPGTELSGSTVHAFRIVTWGLGIVVLLFLLAAHALLGPVIFRWFGPDASYESAIAWVARTVILWVPGVTVVGIVTERLTRNRDDRFRYAIAMLALVVAVTAFDLWLTFDGARDSESGRWWVEHMKSRG